MSPNDLTDVRLELSLLGALAAPNLHEHLVGLGRLRQQDGAVIGIDASVTCLASNIVRQAQTCRVLALSW